jgi:NDP-sugar pyrophosphorylase family protein
VKDSQETIIKDNPIVIMAGGLGTRLRPLTNSIPKPLLNLGNKPILEIIIDNFSSYGFKNIFLAVNYKAEMIKEYFGDGSKFSTNIQYLHEKDRLGTAGALSLLDKSSINKPIFVMNADVLTNVNFENFLYYHEMNNSIASIAVKDFEFQVPYGVINMKNNYTIASINEKPNFNFSVNVGLYVLNPEVLEHIKPGQALDMPDLINDLLEKGKEITSFPIYDTCVDIGEIKEYKAAIEQYKGIK